ncbi:hypothetical protein ACQY0O_000881 [Thecaphora frezii]
MRLDRVGTRAFPQTQLGAVVASTRMNIVGLLVALVTTPAQRMRVSVADKAYQAPPAASNF